MASPRRERASLVGGGRGGPVALAGVAVWVLLGPGTVRAETPAPPPARFARLTTADGLSEPRIQAVLQDRTGFLWIGTPDGLNRYDGHVFRVFHNDPSDPGSLGPGTARALLEDRRGRLWVGLIRGGISVFDPATERFLRYRHDPADSATLSQDDVVDLVEAPDGAVWAATSQGLNRLDPDTGRAIRYTHDASDPQSLGGDNVTSLARDPSSGGLWVALGDGGLDRIMTDASTGRARFEHWRQDRKDPRSLPSDKVNRLLVDGKGGLWVGTWGAGLARYDPSHNAFVRVKTEDIATGRGLLISALLEDRDGMIWVGSSGYGLVRLDPATGRETRYEANPRDPARLSHGSVSALFEDRTGLLWVGTFGGGLNALDLRGQAFRTFELEDASGGVRDVVSVLYGRDGGLWVGTGGGGLLRLGSGGRVIERHRHDPRDSGSLADDSAQALLEDRRGNLWVGTNAGLDLFDRTQGRFLHHRNDPGKPDSLSNDIVMSLHEDAAGRLWVGTFDGLNLFDPATNGFTRHHRPGHRESDSIVAIDEAPEGTIWVGARGQLARLDPMSGTLVSVPLPSEEMDDHTIVWCLRSGPGKALWVGKGPGLFELRPTLGDGPPPVEHHVPVTGGGIVASLGSDKRGRLWLGTSRGLVRYDPRSGQGRRYGPGDGAIADGYAIGAVALGPQGEIAFGTTNGVVAFRPEAVEDDRAPPNVVLTGVRLGHQEVPVGSPLLPRALASMEEIRIPEAERVLTVEFAALAFRAPREIRFRYQLEGFDPGWNELGSDQREVTYTNLSPGRYRLRVTAANRDGVWSEEGTSLWVTLLPPWWATWWFRLSALVGVVMALLAAHNARTRRVRARNERLEHDLHERQQAHDAATRSERQLRLVADALPHLIAQLDENRRFVFSNMALDRAAGRPLEGMLLEEALPPSLLPIVRAPVARALAGEEQDFEADLEAPGTRFRFAITLLPRAEGHGRFGGFYAVAQDITARARLEDAARRQQAQLAHASRVLTLGELAAAIAHELNQPLTAILLNAQAALRLESSRGTPPDDVAGALGDIAADAVRGGEIIRKLRDLVRRGDSKRDTVDLNQAIRGIEPLLRAGAHEQDVVFDLDLAPDLPRTRGDAIQIQQVVLNLAGNAVEAMKAVSPSERRLRIRSAPLQGAVAVEVTDTGPPIAATELDQFFVAFRSTKAEGLGMGLAICRSIVEAHGGRIAARPNPGGGVSVRFTLPVGNPSDSDRP